MKSFTFHLQKVLDLKEKEREQAEWAYGRSVQRKTEEEGKLLELFERSDDMARMLVKVQEQPCKASQLSMISQYRQAVERSIHHQQQTVLGMEQEVERCQMRLRERMRESKLWQRMRERSLALYLEAEKAREQKELDEIGTQLYLRRSN